MTLAEYLRDKIERGVDLYEERTRGIDKVYLDQVEELAKRTRDPELKRFFRETMNSNFIASRLAQIPMLLKVDKLIEADRAFDRLKTQLEFIEAHLHKPFVRAGLKVKRGGKKGASLRHSDAPDRHNKMRVMFAAKRKAGLSKAHAESQVARHFRVSTRTVRTARSGK